MHITTILGRSPLRRKALRQRAWRVLNVVVAVTTLVNVSALGVLISPKVAKADDSSLRSPTATTSPNGWTNGSNALDSDNFYATATNDNDDQGYRNFNIPAISTGATIDGIEVKAEGLTSKSSTVFTENFGTGNSANTIGSGWTENGSDSTDGTIAQQIATGDNTVSPDGGRFALIKGSGGYICRNIDTSNFTSPQLSYYWRGDTDAEDNENGVVEYKTSGNCSNPSGWTNVANHELDNGNTNDSAWSVLQTGAVASSANLIVRFRSASNNTNESFRIDGVSVSGTPSITSELQVRLSGNSGSNFTSRKTQALTTTDSVYTMGSNTDLWGGTWTADSFTNDHFRLEVRLNNPSTGETAKLDHVQVRVYYTPAHTPAANPTLSQSCGLDIALVIDGSGSIDGAAYGHMQDAFNGFVDAFLPGTPTQISITEFATSSKLRQGFTNNATTLHDEINKSRVQPGGQYTNWEAGITTAYNTYTSNPRPTKPDLMVFASDGNPNHVGTGTSVNETVAVNAAIGAANTAKADGIRILALGIGSDVNTSNLQKISSADAVITSSFDTLATTLAGLADELCGGKILVQKQFDTNGDGIAEITGATAGDPLLSGYTFDVNGSPSDPVAQTTSNSGYLEFSVLNGTYGLSETNLPTGTKFVSANCVKGTQPVAVDSITLGSDETVSCTVLNAYNPASLTVTKIVTGGTTADQFGFRIVGTKGDFKYPKTGENTVAFNDLQPGTYNIEETGPGGYHQSNTTCSDKVIAAGENATCDVTNEPNTVTINKDVQNGVGEYGKAKASDWTFTIHSTSSELKFTEVKSGVPVLGVPTGDYYVTESGPDGYKLTSAVGCNLDGSSAYFTVTEQGVTCTLTNTYQPTAPNLTITKTDNHTTATPGETLTYNITVSNSGETAATSVTVDDTLPSYIGIPSDITPAADTSTVGHIIWSDVNVPAMGSTILSYKADVNSTMPVGTKVLHNEALLVCARPSLALVAELPRIAIQCQTTPAVDETSVTIAPLVVAPSLTITKTNNITTFVNPSATVTYTVVVTNSASATETATAVNVIDTLPTGFVYSAGGSATKTFSLGDIKPGKSATTTYSTLVSADQKAGTYTNTAKAKGANTSEVTATSAVEVRVPTVLGVATVATSPSLTLTKTVDTAKSNPGKILTYTMVVTNTGTGGASNVVVTDTLPVGFTFVDGGKDTKSWTFATLAAGASQTIAAKVKIGADVKAGDFTNRAFVTADGLDPVNATAVVNVTVPQVLGLATTGAGWRDYLTFLFGLALIAVGFVMSRRNRRELGLKA